jgi:nitrogen-specific signal transduction histidine kinase
LTVQSQFGGTGLGLTISDQILGLGSKLDLKSKFGEVIFSLQLNKKIKKA